MNNFKYVFFQIFKDLKLFLIFILQIILITFILYSVCSIFISNYLIKEQFKKFDFPNSYSLSNNSMKEFNEPLSKNNTEDLKRKMANNVLTTSYLSSLNINNHDIDTYLTSNMEIYNHRYIKKTSGSNDEINIILGYNYKDMFEVGDIIPITYEYSGAEGVDSINMKVQVMGILDKEQYIFSGTNGIRVTDNSVFLDYEEIYSGIEEEYKSSFLQDILASSIVYNFDKENDVKFEQDILSYLEEKGLDYDIKPLSERMVNVKLILKSRYDIVLFNFIVVTFLSVLILMNYLKVLYNKRRKYYVILILYGKNVLTIIWQLIIEIIIYMLINYIISYVIIDSITNINVILFNIIELMEFILLLLPVILIVKLDKKIVNLIKGVK